MFTSSGVLWNFLRILLPNNFGILFFFSILFFTAFITILGYFLFGRGKGERASIDGYWSLLWPNELSVFAGQYLGIIVSLVIAFILTDTALGEVGSEFPLTTPAAISLNWIYVAFTSALCAFLAFAGNYWIALKKKIMENRSRFRFCMLNSIAFGMAIFIGLLISDLVR